jgi:hypothetical protein
MVNSLVSLLLFDIPGMKKPLAGRGGRATW